jgi:hypothetical protein
MLVGIYVDKIHRQKINILLKTKVRVLFYTIGFIVAFFLIFALYFNMQCHNKDLESELVFGCFTPLISALYTSVSPLLFNIAVIMVILPALIELEVKPRSHLSLKHFFVSDGWRSFYKLSL